MDILERHRAYAFVVLKEPNELWKAGKAAWPEATPYAEVQALQCAIPWKDSIEIEVAKKALLEELGETFFLPTKHELCFKIFNTADACRTSEDKLKAYKLYAEIMGFIEKPAPAQTQVNVQQINKVMVVPTAGTDDNWEARAISHQAKVLENAE